MSHIRYTRIPIEEMIFALAVYEWQLRLVPDDEHNNLPVISLVYTNAQLLRSIGYLRGENKNGYHIFGRPLTFRHILIDDLDEDALDQLVHDDLRPAVGVRTSKGNHQAWITVSNEEIEPAIAKAMAQILSHRYGGDLGSADAHHLGRLPGFTNRKDIYWNDGNYPFTGLCGKVFRGVASGASQLLIEAEEVVASLASSSPPSAPLGGHVSNIPYRNDDYPIEIYDHGKHIVTMSARYEVGDIRYTYDQALDEMINNGYTPMNRHSGSGVDRSKQDISVARYLISQSVPDDIVIEVLLHGSEKAAERGMEYVVRTVNAAL